MACGETWWWELKLNKVSEDCPGFGGGELAGTGRMWLGEDGDGEGAARDEQQKIPRPRLTGVKSHGWAIEQGGAASATLANRCAADGQVIDGA